MINWIKAADRLPEFEKDVLVVDQFGDVQIGSYYKIKDRVLFSCVDDCIGEPTHWMPLPELPAKEGEQ